MKYDQQAGPLHQAGRLQVIDVLRGIAVLGILLVNILSFSLPYQVNQNISIRNEFSGANFYSWLFVNLFIEGTMRALFSMLFGAAGILLLLRFEKSTQAQNAAADIYFRRLLCLLLFGLVNGYLLIWPGDVLYQYALCGIFLFPFRKLKAAQLAVIGLLFLGVTTYKATAGIHEKKALRTNGEAALALEAKNEALTDKQKRAKEAWMTYLEKTNIDTLRQEAAAVKYEMRNGYLFLVRLYSGVTKKRQSIDFYDTYFWDVMPFFFIGMALFKWQVFTGQRSLKLYLGLLVVGYGIGLLISYKQLDVMLTSNFDQTREADVFPVNLYQLKRLLITLGHIALVVLWYKYGVLKKLLKAIARVGQMALTNYLSHALIGGILFYGYGLALFDELQRYQVYLVVIGIWVFQIVFSNVWLHYFSYGPAEWILRSLTYWTIQPLKKPYQ